MVGTEVIANCAVEKLRREQCRNGAKIRESRGPASAAGAATAGRPPASAEAAAGRRATGHRAFGDGGFDVGLDFGEAGEVGFAGGEGLFVEGLEVDGAEGADVRGKPVVPVDEGALGDVDVGGDARQAEAFGAEFGELIFSLVTIPGTILRTLAAEDQTFHWLYWLYWLFFCREWA